MEQIMDQLVARHRDEILSIARQHGVTRLRVVGSRARGDARPDSDLDLLIDLEQGRGLLDMGGFKVDLEDLLGCTVDVGQEGGLRPRARARMLEDAVDL